MLSPGRLISTISILVLSLCLSINAVAASIAAFGDSLTASETYQGVTDLSWLDHIQEGPFYHTLHGNYAIGGSVSGQADHYVYEINGETLEAIGLLGQIRQYLEAGQLADTHVIFSGTNDLLIASRMDPFVSRSGNSVVATSLVEEFRSFYLGEAGRSGAEYTKYIVDNYLVANIGMAIDLLRSAGAVNIVLVGYMDFSNTPVANSNAGRQARAKLAVDLANQAIRDLAAEKGVLLAELLDLQVGTIDEIHTNNETNLEISRRIRSAK